MKSETLKSQDTVVQCIEYVDCPVFRGLNNQVEGKCRNSGSGFNRNCDTIDFSCPAGMTPSTSSVSCVKKTYDIRWYAGKWQYEREKHKVYCKSNKKCPDLPTSLYDDTVVVNCNKDNSKCIYSCSPESLSPTVTTNKCKKGRWKKKKTATVKSN